MAKMPTAWAMMSQSSIKSPHEYNAIFYHIRGKGARGRILWGRTDSFTFAPVRSKLWCRCGRAHIEPLSTGQWHFIFESITMQKRASTERCQLFFGGGGRIRTIEAKRSRFTVCPLWPLGNSPKCSIVNVVRTELLKYSTKKRIVKKKYQIREKYFSIETAEISDGKYGKKTEVILYFLFIK